MNVQPQILEQLSALSDLLRGRILLLLERRELTVTELCAVLQLPQSTVSRHLKTLGDGGWVVSRPDGTRRLYQTALDGADPARRRLWSLTREQIAGAPAAEQDARRLDSVLAERRARSRAFFDDAAQDWDRLRDELFGTRFYLLALLGLLDPGKSIGDLGCGTGRVAEALAPFARKLIAVDGSARMVEAAGARLSRFAHAEVRRGELEALPVEDGILDAATLVLVLHHVSDPGQVVAEVARTLRPGGRLLIVDMLPHDRLSYRQEMGHVWMGFSEDRVRRQLDAAGFDGPVFTPLTPDPAARGPALFAASATLRSDRH